MLHTPCGLLAPDVGSLPPDFVECRIPDVGRQMLAAGYKNQRIPNVNRNYPALSPTDVGLIPRPTGIIAVWTRFFSIAVKQKKDIDFRLSGGSKRLEASNRLLPKRSYGSLNIPMIHCLYYPDSSS
jgi:hypothetical protein